MQSCGEQQLKRMQSGVGDSSCAQRAVRHRLTHVGEQGGGGGGGGGGEEAERAKRAKLLVILNGSHLY